jgi:hypothetical protein
MAFLTWPCSSDIIHDNINPYTEDKSLPSQETDGDRNTVHSVPTAVQIDWWLWHQGEKSRHSHPPHHRTMTIFYWCTCKSFYVVEHLMSELWGNINESTEIGRMLWHVSFASVFQRFRVILNRMANFKFSLKIKPQNWWEQLKVASRRLN